MAWKSARLIGYDLGLGPHDTNLVLAKMGFLRKSQYVTRNGSPTWDITEKGKEYGCQGTHSAIWDERVVDIMRDYLKGEG